MNGKKARAQRRVYLVPSVKQWRDAFAHYQELVEALNAADKALIGHGRGDIADRVLNAQTTFALHFVYLAPPEIAHDLAQTFAHVVGPEVTQALVKDLDLSDTPPTA